MNEHLQELKCGGRPMTKLELLQKENEELKERIHDLLIDDTEYKLENERLNNIINEVRELRKKISNLYYEEGFELDTPMLLKYIDEILDKGEK